MRPPKLHKAVCQGRAFKRLTVLAQIDIRKASGTWESGKMLEAAMVCTAKRTEASLACGRYDMRCRIELAVLDPPRSSVAAVCSRARGPAPPFLNHMC